MGNMHIWPGRLRASGSVVRGIFLEWWIDRLYGVRTFRRGPHATSDHAPADWNPGAGVWLR